MRRLRAVTAAATDEPATSTAAPVGTSYRPSEPVDLRSTLAPLSRGAGDPTMAWDAAGVWRTALTPEGPATLRLEPRVGCVQAWAWGPGAAWALGSVPELLGAGDSWDGFDCSGHALLHQTRRRLPGLRLARVGLVFEMFVPAVLEQKVTGREARRAWRVLVTRWGGVAPGPGPRHLRVCPPAAVWRRVPSWEWHRAGVDPKRSRTVLAGAAVAPLLEGTLSLGRGGPEVAAVLRSVPGVGAWTAAEVTQRAHGDADAVSVGDFHLAAFVGWALVGRPVDDDGMLELLAPWAGHRQRVVRLLEQSGARKPRFGPRLAPEDHRRR